MSEDRVSVDVPQRSASAMAAKRVVQAGFRALVTPRLLAMYCAGPIFGRDRAFLAASESISKVPGQRGVYCRQAFYRSTLESCGEDVYFGFGSLMSMRAARVGERVYIGRLCSLGFVEIGPRAIFADSVVVLSGGREHSREEGSAAQEGVQVFERVRIGEGAWIGSNAVIMADVGDFAVVGAGAVVTRPVPARATAVGVPARARS